MDHERDVPEGDEAKGVDSAGSHQADGEAGFVRVVGLRAPFSSALNKIRDSLVMERPLYIRVALRLEDSVLCGSLLPKTRFSGNRGPCI